MTSETKIAASRLNGKKSRGPKTLRGKLQSSRNAWRHGLAATPKAEPTASPAVKRMAKAICGDAYVDPDLYDLAVTIARWQIVLLGLRTTRNAAAEPRGTPHTKVEGIQELAPSLPCDEAGARLGRYERRARSARDRAIRLFVATSVYRASLKATAKTHE
jgi:hypothetical protein